MTTDTVLTGPQSIEAVPHRPLAPATRRWLVHLADPAGLAPRPAHPLPVGDLGLLFEAAELHGVLGAVARAVRPLVAEAARGTKGVVAETLRAARDKIIAQAASGMLLEYHRKRVSKAFRDAGIRGTVVKGAVAASRLYPDASLRSFTDIDVLLEPCDRAAASEAMTRLGFTLAPFPDREGRDYHEDKWILRREQDVMVEVHTDLVHNPKLNAVMNISYQDVHDAGKGDPAAATALLFVAGAHAAVGHQFDRLQQLVDIVQAARGAAGPVDPMTLRACAERSGVVHALVTAIELAGRTFSEPRCAELSAHLDAGHGRRWQRFLITPEVVLAAQSEDRSRSSWRRNLYRQFLKRGTRREGAEFEAA
jgi:hypothetical protein